VQNVAQVVGETSSEGFLNLVSLSVSKNAQNVVDVFFREIFLSLEFGTSCRSKIPDFHFWISH